MRRKRVKNRTPTRNDVAPKISNSGYSEGGASQTNKALKTWRPKKLSAKSDIGANLALLRNRSNDQAINTPLGSAAIHTSAIHAIGSGLRVFPRPNGKILGLSPAETRQWSKQVAQEFELWASSTECDILHRNTFYDMQWIAYLGYLIDGDIFAAMRRKPTTNNMPYTLRIQLIEGNRVGNPSMLGVGDAYVESINPTNNNRVVNGVEIDDDGAVVAYWVSNIVQGDATEIHRRQEWQRIEAYGKRSGFANIIQVCHDVRPEQYRGVPYLAPVLESLKQVSRYTSAELTSAIVKSFFSLFFTAEQGSNVADVLNAEQDTDEPVVDVGEYNLGPGTLNALPKGVDVKTVDASNAQSTFEAFTNQLIKQIAAAINQPYEVLMKSFTSSYSASRAAMLQAWEEYKLRRVWFARDFCQPIYEMWLVEAIATGRINAPGFFDDPVIRNAWCQTNWFGPTMSILDPQRDVQGSMLRTQAGLSTREREAAEMTGTDFEENMEQLAYEASIIEELGLTGLLSTTLSQQVTPVARTKDGQKGDEDNHEK